MYNLSKCQILNYAILLFFGVFIFSACGKKEFVTAKEMPESVKDYVYAYTAGVISKNDPVRVRFAGSVVSEDKIGREANIISFSPSTGNTAIWEDDHTLRVTPNKNWESGASYVATVALGKVFSNLPKDAQSFEFGFIVRGQSLDVEIYSIESIDPENLTNQELLGLVQTNDFVEAADLEKVLTVSQNKKDLPIIWNHESDGTKHYFTAQNVLRGEKAGKVDVSWNGSPIGLKVKDKQTVDIPSLSDFSVMSASVVSDENQHIVLYFSDPLLSSQNLEGLIAFRGNPVADDDDNSYNSPRSVSLSFTIDGNKVLAYPSQRIAGTQSIELRPGIRNSFGKSMEKPSVLNLNFEQIKPKVRLVGRGVILPSSDKGLVLPFDAIGLQAVEVEIFKIFDNNILQFLQTNNLSSTDDYELTRVGRVIRQEMVPLKGLSPNAKTGSWIRYALDLGKLFKADPNAIYQVRIGFRPEYAIYECGNKNREENLVKVSSQSSTDDNGEIRSMWNSYYGIDGYYEDFQWSHRSNPCFPAYYNSDNFIQTNVFASDLGITAKGGNDNNWFIAVADLRSAKPVGEVELEFYDFQNQLIQTAKTTGDGLAQIPLSRKPFLIIGKKEKMKGYLKTADGNSLSLSRFDVAGTVAQKGLKGFLYGDRGVWRPGDSLFLNFILEDKEGALPNNYPIAFELHDSRGQLQYKTVTTKNEQNLYALPVATSPEAPTGSWIATVKAGGASFTKALKIETVKPNRLKIDLDFGKTELSGKDEPVRGKIKVNWLHGAAGQNLKTIVEAEARQVKTEFKKFPNYEFDDPARRLYWTEPTVIFDGETDKNGNASFSTMLFAADNTAPGKLNINFVSRAFEKGGDFSTTNTKMSYSPYSSYTGISISQNQSGENRFDIGKDGEINFAAVDEKGNPLKSRKLSIGLYRVEWRWWWDSSDDYVSQFNSSNHFNAISKDVVNTGSNGTASWNVNVSSWGRYMVRVCDTESGHCSGDFFYAGYPWYEDDGISTRQEAAMMTFTASQEKYKVGDKVEIKVPAGDKGRVLVTLETGSEVIQSFWKDVKQGENKFDFKATDAMSPTVYVHVSLIQPHGQMQNDLPIRMYGVLPIAVEDPKTILKPVIAMQDELKPDQEFTVEVKEEKKAPMAYTIAIVDEGLLGLTNFKTPDPHSVLYAKEALGVRTWDLYDYVLGAYGGELERILSIGGDAEINPPIERKNANRFTPVVLQAGPFYLSGGSKKHTFKMPNYVGSVRVMVVAAHSDGAYGSTEKIVPVKKPLMALATLPRVLGPTESLRLPVSIFAMDGKVKKVDVKAVETSGLVSVSGGTKQLSFSQPGEDMAYFDLKVGEKTGIAKFKITASGGGEQAEQDIELDIRNPNPIVANVYDELMQPGANWATTMQPFGSSGINTAVLEISNIPPLKLGERLRFLIQYPHGCIEQITSGAFPQLYVGKLTKLTEQQKAEAKSNVESVIARMKNYQLASGGFSYWPGSDYDPWATNYAGHFLLEAKDAGYAVPATMLDRFIKYQQEAAKRWSPNNRGSQYSWTELDQAYRLYTLALARKPDMASMNRMKELTNISNESRWRLAAAYALAGKKEIGQQLAKNLPVNVKPYEWFGNTYGSSLRDEAMILETQVLLEDMTAAAANMRHIAEKLSENSWYSTQTTSYALLAIGKFVGKSKVSESFKFRYDAGDGKWVNAESYTPVMQISVPANSGKKMLKVENTGSGVLFGRLIVTGAPLIGDNSAAANDLQIAVSYMLPDGSRINPSAIPQGADFIAEVAVTHPGTRGMDYKELALTQIFPSGWEIINTRLHDLDEFSNSSIPKYQDIRDDRVLTYFDIRRGARQIYRVRLNAAYQGRYYLPTVSCEAQYDNTISARQPGLWVEVVAEGKEL